MHDIGKVRTPLDILQQADEAGRRRDRGHAAPPGGRRRDPPQDARPHAARRHRRVRAPPPPGRQRLSRWASFVRRSTWPRCCARSRTSTTRCGRSGDYQEAFPADRILEVLKRGEGQEFEQNLVRRFVQLMGLYPVGSLVRAQYGRVRGRDAPLRRRPAPPARARRLRGRRPPPRRSLRHQPLGSRTRAAPVVVGHRARPTRPTRTSTRWRRCRTVARSVARLAGSDPAVGACATAAEQ